MSTTLVVNGVSYTLPTRGEENWSTQVNSFFQALANTTLQKSGGTFTLTADIDFGSSKGLLVKYLTSKSANPATAGVVRLANLDAISWKNAAGSGNLDLIVNALDRLSFNGAVVPSISSTDTITNKDLTSTTNVLTGATADSFTHSTSGNTITLPDAVDTLVGKATTDTLTNKSIDADDNTLSNLETDNFKSGVIDTDDTMSADSDTVIPTQKAVKKHVADAIASIDEADEISYDNTSSGLTATDVQAAIDEVEGRLDQAETDVSTVSGDLSSHTGDTGNPHSVTQEQVMGDDPLTLAANATPSNPASGHYKIYPKNDGKIYRLDSAGVEQMVGGGGGLVTEAVTLADFTGTPKTFTATAGKHYLVDMDGAAEQYTITLPQGAAEAAVRVTVKNNDSTTYPLTVDGDGTEKIFYEDEEHSDVDFVYAEQWAEFSWDTEADHWVVDDGSTPLSGTFSGSLDFTDGISFNGGDQLSAYDTVNSSTSATVTSGGGSISSGTPTIYYRLTKIGNVVVGAVCLAGTYNLTAGVSGLGISVPAGFAPASAMAQAGSAFDGSGYAYSVYVGTSVLQIARVGTSLTFTDMGNNVDTGWIPVCYTLA